MANFERILCITRKEAHLFMYTYMLYNLVIFLCYTYYKICPISENIHSTIFFMILPNISLSVSSNFEARICPKLLSSFLVYSQNLIRCREVRWRRWSCHMFECRSKPQSTNFM